MKFRYKIKKVENISLSRQLVYVTLVALVICAVSLGVVLPAILKPFYERSVYAYLKQPSNYIRPETNKMGEDISFIIITRSGAVYTSDNLSAMLPNLGYKEIIDKASKSYGKFIHNKNTYYYLWGETNNTNNLIITDQTQVLEQEKSLLGIIFPTMIATLTITVVLLVAWSQHVLKKVKKLDKKTNALITGEKLDDKEFVIDDELNELNITIDEVNRQLKEKDEYKNMMFQNLSHELKTPIAVIQSYVEGVEDEVVDKDEAIKIIAEETANLSNQVKAILQINKIDYMKDSKEYLDSRIRIDKVIHDAVEKHKLIRTDIEFIVNIEDNEYNYEFVGTEDMWKTVLDNILGNFIRYAKTKIVIKIEDKKIILENDGDKLDENIIKKMFLPYVKGEKGQTGLGLSIVKKTVNIFGYDITASNTNDGVKFVIK